ncbi:uncharacterized protein METZ01_LOCUS91303 [marine metagenome]|uniref:3-keto-alpha-glucoside-1,2-lyase/3-keto-2-hydroxy-glucal hydratase domain-containing protein n=1 Tax=marine metagenome TaxID=408172 RepID=A0A381VDL9_9ZZZZ
MMIKLDILFLIIRSLCICITISLATTQDLSNIPDSAWVQLFNGKNMDGWNYHFSGQEYNVDPQKTLRVEDSILKVDYSNYDNWNGAFGHFARDEVYSYYIFAVEYRFVGDQTPGGPDWALRNNGIMFHSESMRSMGKNQNFPISVEAQLLQRGTDEKPTAVINLCNGASNTTASEKPNCNQEMAAISIPHKNSWVRAEVLVLSDSIAKFILNGDTLGVYSQFKYLSDGKPVKEGRIALQAESHPTDFRKIEVVNLVGCMDTTAINYKPYLFKHDPDSCVAE